MPLGEPAWSDTVVVLPASSPQRWVSLFTRAESGSGENTGTSEMPVSALLRDFPVAMLSARH
jgi:hypothetical protein